MILTFENLIFISLKFYIYRIQEVNDYNVVNILCKKITVSLILLNEQHIHIIVKTINLIFINSISKILIFYRELTAGVDKIKLAALVLSSLEKVSDIKEEASKEESKPP